MSILLIPANIRLWLLRLWMLLVVPSATFAYDGQNQANPAYDSSRQSADSYNVVPVLTAGNRDAGTTGSRVSLVKFADFLAAETAPRAYSVAFEVQLAPPEFGLRRDIHFQIANEALQAEQEVNPVLAELVPAPVGSGRPPAGWTWQHATIEQGGGNAGVLQLVPRNQHTPGSPFWPLLHPLPGGAGGYSQWAIPAGAPRN